LAPRSGDIEKRERARTPRTNLALLRRSRKKAARGDVFALLPSDGRGYLFGRVIRVELPAPFIGQLIIYIYRHRSINMLPEQGSLLVADLLLPPIITNELGWRHGLFVTVANWPLQPLDVLRPHCFLDPITGRYYDEEENALPAPVPPCGEYGLVSYRRIDDLISDALGIPRAPID
jgi:hypothetical protein